MEVEVETDLLFRRTAFAPNCRTQKRLILGRFLEACVLCRGLILVAFITGNSSLEPLIEGLYAQIHVNLR